MQSCTFPWSQPSHSSVLSHVIILTQRELVWTKSQKQLLIINEEDIRENFVSAFNEIYDEKEFILAGCRDLLEEYDDTSSLDAQIEEHIRKGEIIAELNRKLLDENASTAMDQDEFSKKYAAYKKEYEEEVAQVEKLQEARAERLRKAEMVSAFMFGFHEQEGMIKEFDERLWLITVDHVKIHRDGTMTFIFKTGTEVTR